MRFEAGQEVLLMIINNRHIISIKSSGKKDWKDLDNVPEGLDTAESSTKYLNDLLRPQGLVAIPMVPTTPSLLVIEKIN